ncbi:hypothetical protein SDC9_73912 [bioreactor metagenome]|uniref:Uncharacterized protein n=1 Tax=bioreactor metagenome TaxID=1076179 RepID=A0A644YHN6_9ZZZZ
MVFTDFLVRPEDQAFLVMGIFTLQEQLDTPKRPALMVFRDTTRLPRVQESAVVSTD